MTVQIAASDKADCNEAENGVRTINGVNTQEKVSISASSRSSWIDAMYSQASEPSVKSRVRNVISAWNERSGSREDREVGSSLSDIADSRDASDIAFTVRRVMAIRDITKLAYTEVDIQAQGLRTFLKDMIGPEYPNQSWEGQTINMTAPFAPIVFNWDKLQEETKAKEGDDAKLRETREDLAQLLKNLERADELTTYFKTRDSNSAAKVTTWETMWTIFAPGTEVIAKPFLNTVQIFKVDAPPGAGPGNRKTVYCWGYDWNGKELVKSWYDFPIEKFNGTQEIHTLDCYPFEFHQDDMTDSKDASGGNPLRKKLIDRGKSFTDLCRVPRGARQMFDYDDLVLWSKLGRGIIARPHKTVSIASRRLM